MGFADGYAGPVYFFVSATDADRKTRTDELMKEHPGTVAVSEEWQSSPLKIEDFEKLQIELENAHKALVKLALKI